MAIAPNKYLKWIIIAVVLAATGHGLTIYTFKLVDGLINQFHELDKQVAVLEERMHNIDGRGGSNNSLAH